MGLLYWDEISGCENFQREGFVLILNGILMWGFENLMKIDLIDHVNEKNRNRCLQFRLEGIFLQI